MAHEQPREIITMRRLIGIAASIGCLLFTTQAGAVDASVRTACRADYRTYCDQHDPNGSEVRKCMRANSTKLSKGCVDALVAAGEVSRAELARLRAER
jgi:hypothetical protein